MTVISGLDTMRPPTQGCVLTIGNFDGVHLGHQRLVARARELATPAGRIACVLTFDPSPAAVLHPDRPVQRIMLLQERLHLLEQAGADMIVVAHTDKTLLSQSAKAFMHTIVRDRFNARFIVEGSSFRFGRDREGDTDMLIRLADALGIGVEVVAPVEVELPGQGRCPVSSTLIRRCLLAGDVESAAVALGRPHVVIGTVVEGLRRGRTLGFPTINLDAPGQLWPADGVYAGRVEWKDHSRLAAISIGHARTFGDGERKLEAHLLDFSGDLYGWRVRVLFTSRIRNQIRFEDGDALRRRLSEDVEWIRHHEHRQEGATSA